MAGRARRAISRPRPENALRVWQALEAFGAPLGELTRDDLATSGVVFQIGIAAARIDILTALTGLEFDLDGSVAREFSLFDDIADVKAHVLFRRLEELRHLDLAPPNGFISRSPFSFCLGLI